MERTQTMPARSADRRINLKSLDRSELESLAIETGEPPFRGRQMFKWLYGKAVREFDEMTDLPQPLRDRLAEIAVIPQIELVTRRQSVDGTIKCLFRLDSGRFVESVLIPDFDEEGDPRRVTVCVSSQVGCAMGCAFCATGLMGFQQNLTAGEIYDQVYVLNRIANEQHERRITNVVYMGMGEPLLNYDNVLKSTDIISHPDGLGMAPRRITVSTVGLARRISQLADDATKFNLAVSLHAPTEEKRSAIMPVNRAAATDLNALKESLRHYYAVLKRPVTYEYCMFHEYNDHVSDARALIEVTKWIPSKVNLIMYNPVEGLSFSRSSETRLNRFIATLADAGVRVTVRRSRGQDIDAACGQLAVKDQS